MLHRFLVLVAGGQPCAIPLSSVVETMRPPAVRVLSAAPSFVLGVAPIRGCATPIVDLAKMLFDEPGTCRRLVTVAAEAGAVGLAVDEVRGFVGDLVEAAHPPLLREALPGVVEAIARLDQGLMLVLSRSLRLPDEVWAAAREEAS